MTNDIDHELDLINWVRAVRDTARPEGMPERQWAIIRLALIWSFGASGYVPGPEVMTAGPSPAGPVRLEPEKARDVLRWAVALGLVERSGGPDAPPGYRVVSVPRVAGTESTPGTPTLV